MCDKNIKLSRADAERYKLRASTARKKAFYREF
jgi:hypothetical protein